MRQQTDIEDGATKCPTCGQSWPESVLRRVCRVCRQVISPNHKYRFVPLGPMAFSFEHRDCQNPEHYENEGPRAIANDASEVGGGASSG